MASGICHADGVDLYWERSGSGAPLVVLNGSGMALEGAAPLVDLFRGPFDLLAFDHRGMGRSSLPAGPYTMADCAADVAALLDAQGWSSCRVVGISFGGMVAQELAVTWPERVDRLALLCTSPGGSGGASYPLHELADLPPDERVRTFAELLDTRFTPEFLAEHPEHRALVDLVAAGQARERTPEQLEGERLQMEARRAHDVCDRLGTVTCPTLVASGRWDGIAPPANGAFIASHVPHAEQRLYDGGHAFFVQDPAALPQIIDFLSAD
jgi:3-oxoadipate enol-lactonase